MKPYILAISLSGLLAFGLPAAGTVKLSTTGQYFVVVTTASGFDHNGALGVDHKQTAFGAVLCSEQDWAVSSTGPGAQARASIRVEGWRTNLSGDTYEFEGLLGGEAALVQEGSCAGSSVEYRQVYDFSVNTMVGGTETVTIDVSQLGPSTLSPGVHFSGLQASLSRDGVGYDFDIFYNAGVSVFHLPEGNYRLSLFVRSAIPNGYGDAGFAVSWKHAVRFSNLSPASGCQHNFPIIKDPPLYRYDFRDTPKATWVGQPAATEFSFQMIGNSLFTGIMGFPPGFTNQFEVVCDGSSLGFFATNQPVDFVGLVGHAVRSFNVRNIGPLAEGDSSTFAIALNYDTPTADFVMIPNPGLSILSASNGTVRVFFAGALEQSTNLNDWIDVPGSPVSPYLVTPTTSPVPIFFRSRRQ